MAAKTPETEYNIEETENIDLQLTLSALFIIINFGKKAI